MLLQADHTFCVCALYVHVVFDDKHVLNLMYVRACMWLPQIKQRERERERGGERERRERERERERDAHYRLVSRFTGVHFNMVCMNVHELNIL